MSTRIACMTLVVLGCCVVAGSVTALPQQQEAANQQRITFDTDARIYRYDGTEAAPVADADAWYQVFHIVRGELVQARSWPDVVEVRQRTARAARAGVVPIALLDVALLGGDQPRKDRIGGPATFPGRVIVAAALDGRIHQGSNVRFICSRHDFYTDRDGVLPRLTIDFDDGTGFRPVTFDSPVEIGYSSTGRKLAQLRAVWPDGTTARAQFQVEVVRLDTPVPDEIWTITAEIPYLGGYGSGLAYVYLADGHVTVTDPVVVIEGFDIDNSMNWEELYSLLNQETMLETLRGEGFDFVIVNFDESNDYIQRHAFVTVEVLERVNTLIEPTVDSVVAGASMGGLVGRYALTYLEQQGSDPRVRTYIAFDSPHRGASIPLGLQHWVDFFAAESSEAAFLRDALDQPSPRQMLVYHYAASPPGSAASDPLRGVFDQELADLGGYPQSARNVSIVNGSSTGQNQGYTAGDQIVLYEYESFIVDIVGNVWAVPDGTQQVIFDGLIDRIWPLPDDERTVSVAGTMPYDTAPGGFRPSMAQLDTTAVPYGDLIALYNNHCFIPTISALDLATDDLFYDIAGDPDLLSLTPFDAVYYPQENQQHNAVTPENAIWFQNEVRRTVTAARDQYPGPPAAPFALQVYPNPFNPRVTISFELDQMQQIDLAVYDLAGRRLADLTSGVIPAGIHTAIWSGRDSQGRAMPSGTYFYRLEAGGYVQTKGMTLIR